jgi:hypothetical protein
MRPAEEEVGAALQRHVALKERLVRLRGEAWVQGDCGPRPLRREACAACGVPPDHAPLVPWSNLCADHADDPAACERLLPLREREARESDVAHARDAASLEEARELRAELRPEAVRDREREARARADFETSAREFFARR